MTHIQKLARPSATALAFALALSTTPLAAQTGGSPVVTLPTPAPPVSAPAPALPTPAVPTMRAAAPTAEPVAAVSDARPAPRAATTANRARTAARSQPTARAATPANAPSAPTAVRAEAEPAPALPVVPLTETPVLEPAPATAPVEPVAADGGTDMLPIAGGAAGLLLLAGGAYALSRRRRHAEDDGYATETWGQDHVAYADPIDSAEPARAAPEPVVTPLPALARESQVDPALAPSAAGTDPSRYGRHMQAAFAGPTPENPSLSLKRRLKRAAFFDQRERMAREAGEPSEMAQPVATPQAASTPSPQRDQMVHSRRVSAKAGTQALFGFRPAAQH